MSKYTLSTHLIGAVGAFALLAGSASAADLGGSTKDGPVAYTPAYNWSGLYVGAHAGLAVGSATGGDIPLIGALTKFDMDLDGAIYGGQIGYNIQRGSLVVGVEGTFSGADIDGQTACVLVFNCKKEIDWATSLVGRLGVAFDRAHVYGLAGVTWAEINSEFGILNVGLASGSETHVGWIVGAGVEYALTDMISTRIEYAHADYGSEKHDMKGPLGFVSIPSEVDAQTDTIKLGLNIKLTR